MPTRLTDISTANSTAIAAGKARLDALRPLATQALAALRHYYDVELTYSSNAIEGNTLTHGETALIIEKGITIGGKSLTEHLEASDHYAAVQLMRAIATGDDPPGEDTVVRLHHGVVARSRPAIAGMYSRMPRRVAGSAVIFPNPAKIPDLMRQFGSWLADAPADPTTAFEAHLRLVSIHPFEDGNGRTARLLMNLVLICAGYPPIPIRPQQRAEYLRLIEQRQLGAATPDYADFLAAQLVATLDGVISACEQALPS